jgi:DNA-binding NtrC family response regulator
MNEHKSKAYAGKAALIVEDDPDCLEQVRNHLENCGFEVVSAESQAEAEKIIDDRCFDLAVIDLMLENKDSGFILSYKTKRKCKSTPVILITCVASEAGLHFASGEDDPMNWVKADAILDKQIRFEQLDREIDRLMTA